MENAKMVRQANQIAEYFNVYPEPRSADGVLGHIQKFWEPRMRAQLVGYVDGGGEGLHPLVVRAARELGAKPTETG